MFRQTQDQTERLATGAAWRIWELRPGTEDSQEVGLRRASLVICPEVLRTQSPNSPAERVLHHKQTQVRLRVSHSEQRPMAATKRKTSLQGRRQLPRLPSQLPDVEAGRQLSAMDKSLACPLCELPIFFCHLNPPISNTAHTTVCLGVSCKCCLRV